MSSVPEGRPFVRGEHVYLRAPERDDIPLFVRWFSDAEVLCFTNGSPLRDEWAAQSRRRSWRYD